VRVEPLTPDSDPDSDPDSNPDPHAGGPHQTKPDADSACLIYTSGSTGTPRAVRVGHRALLNVVLALADAMGCGPGDTWLTMASATFDISLAEFCVPLTTGAALVVTSERDLRDAGALVRLIAEHRVTRMQAVPSQWRALLDAGFDAPDMVAMTGGEALTARLADELRARVGALFNGYGPTETTVLSTLWPVPPRARDIAIGTPIANTRLYVLDDHGQPVADGEPGELHIAGTGVARGYRGRPDLTEQLFLPDPDGPLGSRRYRTGDRVRRRADGALEFLGRDDGQVKVRGQRVELGEVEARMADHPKVAGVAAKVHDDTLVAYVVLTASQAATPAALREHAGRLLPPAMVPSLFVLLDAFPLTPHGKIDKAALAVPERTPADAAPSRPDGSGGSDGSNGLDGMDAVTAALCEICREVLGIPVVRPEDDLFDLGAHSLVLMQIIGRLGLVLGATIPVDILYDADLVSDVAAAVVGHLG
jgi:amino acid adenylation domain-containing protein